MEQVQKVEPGKDEKVVAFCMRILSSVTLAYHPIHLKELVGLAGLPQELLDDLQSLRQLVDLCSSFLTV